MTPINVPITAWRNARFEEEWSFDDEGEPFDLTGYTGALQVRNYGAQPGAALISIGNVTIDAAEGVWIIEPAAGILKITIDQATLAAAYDALIGNAAAGSPIVLVYDLRLTSPGGAPEVWMEGIFTINPGVTIGG